LPSLDIARLRGALPATRSGDVVRAGLPETLADALGGSVARTGTSEYGRTDLNVLGGELHSGLPGTQPVWMSHGVRGDFVDYRGKARFATHANWQFTIFDSGALPYFEYPQDFAEKMLAFMAQGPGDCNPL
jgi:hypothetical protein